MKICQVVKPLVSTNRIPGMEHKHLQVVQDGSTQLVAVDPVGTRPGDWPKPTGLWDRFRVVELVCALGPPDRRCVPVHISRSS